MKKLLICEDEDAIREFEVITLRRAGYEVVDTACGEDAIKAFNAAPNDFSVVLLDIMMPGIDGFTVCKKIREKNSRVGIIMLSAKTQEMDKVNGLMLGADDYVTKPFSPSELMARVDVLYRRVEMSAGLADSSHANVITSGEFELNMRNRTLTKNGIPIELTQVEFQIMEYFFTNQDAALSRTDILEKVWGNDYFGEEKIVDVNIRRLRMKVEDNPSAPKHLLTMWGVGYKWIA